MAARQILWLAFYCGLQFLGAGQVLSKKESESIVDISGLFYRQEGCPYLETSECPNSNISYYLYTRETQDAPYLLDISKPETILNAKFIPGVPLKIIIHGYTGHKDFAPNQQLRPAYFEHGEYNILTIDWGKLAPAPCYYEAAHNVEFVAKCAAKMLDMLILTRSEVDLNNTHILGFSLGAHVGGLMAASVTAGYVPRVTAFDPALPLFDQAFKPEDEMIRADVAIFVDVYHSNTGLQGKLALCGDVDVYFNNGTSQPGCNCSGTCDHLRAVQYFAESINSPTGLWGYSCDSWSANLNGQCAVDSVLDLVELGDSITIEDGSFLALTNREPPFLLPPYAIINDHGSPEKFIEECSIQKYMEF